MSGNSRTKHREETGYDVYECKGQKLVDIPAETTVRKFDEIIRKEFRGIPRKLLTMEPSMGNILVGYNKK